MAILPLNSNGSLLIVKQGVVPQTYWTYEEVGHTQDAKKEIVVLFGEEQRRVGISTNYQLCF